MLDTSSVTKHQHCSHDVFCDFRLLDSVSSAIAHVIQRRQLLTSRKPALWSVQKSDHALVGSQLRTEWCHADRFFFPMTLWMKALDQHCQETKLWHDPEFLSVVRLRKLESPEGA
jgi:hypothetical protein